MLASVGECWRVLARPAAHAYGLLTAPCRKSVQIKSKKTGHSFPSMPRPVLKLAPPVDLSRHVGLWNVLKRDACDGEGRATANPETPSALSELDKPQLHRSSCDA